MKLLKTQFNPESVNALMCTNLVSIDWRGNVYDCDFNQMVETPDMRPTKSIWDFDDFQVLRDTEVATGNHCLGCTAGAGSSCGGALA